LGHDLAIQLRANLSQFQDSGLDRLNEETRERVRARYAAFDHPGAREVMDWLDGAWTITRAEIEAT
jgi:hypothetical protein